MKRGAKIKHGLSKHKFYTIWSTMKQRCESLEPHKKRAYKDKGISVCESWLKFENFHRDMFATWEDGLWLDRKNGNLGYSKSNCRWVTPREQQWNRANNKMVTFDGETKSLAEWCSILNINYGRTYTRLQDGWDSDDALTVPARKKTVRNMGASRIIKYNGEVKTAGQWANDLGMGINTLLSRLRRGWSVHQSFTRPLRFLSSRGI